MRNLALWTSEVLDITSFAVILLGSIHLGYHYAADGLISIVGVSLIWLGVGRWLDRHPAPVGAGS